jgi:hypothetical protein
MAELLLLEHRYFGQRALVEVKRILFKRPVNRKSALAAIALHAGRHEQNRICGRLGAIGLLPRLTGILRLS